MYIMNEQMDTQKWGVTELGRWVIRGKLF